MFLKKRKAKMSERGIYIQDMKLNETLFQPGTHYKYVVDLQNRKVVILPAAEGNKVCTRYLKTTAKPVIDIRSKEVRSVFEGCSHLQVSISEDQVIVEGYLEEKKSFVSTAKDSIKNVLGFGKRASIIDITNILEVRKKVEVVLSKSELKKAAGNSAGWVEQLSFDIFESELRVPSIDRFVKENANDLEVVFQAISLFSGAVILPC